MSDEQAQVDHPHYYTQGIECMDYIASHGLWEDYCAGNILKYMTRYAHKNGVQDLRKARWYLDYMIMMLSDGDVEEGKPLRIYVAGPYSADTKKGRTQNIQQATDVAAILAMAGHYPFCPHMHTAEWDDKYPMDWDYYMAHGLAMQRTMQAVFFQGDWRNSNGSLVEHEQATNWGQQIFLDYGEVPQVADHKTASAIHAEWD